MMNNETSVFIAAMMLEELQRVFGPDARLSDVDPEVLAAAIQCATALAPEISSSLEKIVARIT
jgi:hypothetical protein